MRHEQQLLAPTIQRVSLSRRERDALRRKSDDYCSRHRAGWDLRWRVNAEPLDLAGASALAHRLRAADRQVEMQRTP